MKNFCVQKGKHLFKPYFFKFAFRKKTFKVSVLFGEKAKYLIEGEDQWDWNKLTGISYSFPATRRSFMIGWRYNPKKDKFELTWYVHDKDGRRYGEPILSVGKVARVDIEVKVKRKHLEYTFGKKKTIKVPFRGYRVFGYIIHPWFGGTSAAPQNVCLQLDIQ